MTQAEQALESAKHKVARQRYPTIRRALNGASPRYYMREAEFDGQYTVYHYKDHSYVMMYSGSKSQDVWTGKGK